MSLKINSVDINKMRLECEFSTCSCVAYTGKGRCDHCDHGKCWHKLECQFASTRPAVRRPIYDRIPVAESTISRPLAPAIDSDSSEEYCESVIGLPV